MSRKSILAALVIFIGAGALVFSQGGQQSAPPARDYSPAPVRNGKKYIATREIIFDQASQTLRRPTTEETQALVDQISSLTNRSTEGLSVTQAAHGGESVNLQGRFGGVVLGRAMANGTLEVRCVTTLQEAVEFLGLEEAPQQQ